jgi:hypothetical protein
MAGVMEPADVSRDFDGRPQCERDPADRHALRTDYDGLNVSDSSSEPWSSTFVTPVSGGTIL